MMSMFLCSSFAWAWERTFSVSNANPTKTGLSSCVYLWKQRYLPVFSSSIRRIWFLTFLIFSAETWAGLKSATAAAKQNVCLFKCRFWIFQISLPQFWCDVFQDLDEVLSLRRPTGWADICLLKISSAIRKPILPEEWLPMNRTGSIGSEGSCCHKKNWFRKIAWVSWGWTIV